VQKVREAAARTQCQNNLKQMGIAFHMFADSNQRLPVGATDKHYFGGGWAYDLLPFVEEANEYRILSASPNGWFYGYGASASDFTDPNSFYYPFVHLWNYKAKIYECPSAPLDSMVSVSDDTGVDPTAWGYPASTSTQ